ncbi:ORF6N domain-containing protein [Pseudoruminococcus massiliensis]|uniref:ORF6N domain-containing protein n=1 Tax=Pseudoruminococcus massiliensis TaxID=2086583 RepID=UPI000D1138B3
MDQCHGRPNGTARKRFNDNKAHFIEGVDYFVRKTDEAATEYGVIAPNGLTLITESGYLMLVKSLKFNINVSFLLFLSIFCYNSYLKKQIYIVYDFFRAGEVKFSQQGQSCYLVNYANTTERNNFT